MSKLHKWCPACEKSLLVECFYKNRAKSDGLSIYCRECRKAKRKSKTPFKRKKRSNPNWAQLHRIGKKYNRLTLLKRAPDYIAPNKAHVAMWKCLCDCGVVKVIRLYSVLNGNTTSCGCYNRELAQKAFNERHIAFPDVNNIIGLQFGRLTVVNYLGYRRDRHHHLWGCQCVCGNVVVRDYKYLVDGMGSGSCGCYRKTRSDKGTKKGGLDGT